MALDSQNFLHWRACMPTTLRVQCTKAKHQANRGFTTPQAISNCYKLTIRGAYIITSALWQPLARDRPSMRSIDLALPFNWLARILGSFSVRTPIIVLALIPVAGFLANGVTYVSGEGDVGRADATVTQSHALVDSNRDFKSAVEAEGLEAQVRQFLTNVQAA